jgi:acetyl esterase/lipase
MSRILIPVLLTLSLSAGLTPQQRKFTKHENVIYGMISGMALLMDVYQPENGNNIGIICIPGSGFGYFGIYQRVFNQVPLKDDYVRDNKYGAVWMQGLVDAGYTLFVINHRFSPRFQFPDAVEDTRRAVRFIRYNAQKYNINSAKIGAIGQSSGGNLSAMLGVFDAPYANPNKNPIDSVSSRVQAVVAIAAPFVISDFNSKADTGIQSNADLRIIVSYLGELPSVEKGEFALTGKFAEASPITHVSTGDAPMLIYYSDNDPLIPQRQALAMHKKLVEAGVETEIIMTPGMGHEPMPDLKKVDAWFHKYLKQ